MGVDGVTIISLTPAPHQRDAIGAGLCFAAACDMRYAAEDAKLGFTFTTLGLSPGMAATHFVPKVLWL